MGLLGVAQGWTPSKPLATQAWGLLGVTWGLLRVGRGLLRLTEIIQLFTRDNSEPTLSQPQATPRNPELRGGEGFAWGWLGVGSGLAWGLISRFSITDYEVNLFL